MEDTKRLIICTQCARNALCVQFLAKTYSYESEYTVTEALRVENIWNSFTCVQEHFPFFMRCDQRCGNPNWRICSPIASQMLYTWFNLDLRTHNFCERNQKPCACVTRFSKFYWQSPWKLLNWTGTNLGLTHTITWFSQSGDAGTTAGQKDWGAGNECGLLWLVHDFWLSS